MSEQSKIKERRAQAYLAASADDVDFEREVIVAVEAATRVKIDDDIVRIHRLAWLEAYNERLIPTCDEHSTERCPMHFNIIDVQKDALVMTLKELGFEVES